MFRTQLEARAFNPAECTPHHHLDCSWDIFSWRRHHVLCENCGLLFTRMSPMEDMIRHWTGACTRQKSDDQSSPAVAANMSAVELLQEVSWLIPAETKEANQFRLAVRLLRDLPRLMERTTPLR